MSRLTARCARSAAHKSLEGAAASAALYFITQLNTTTRVQSIYRSAELASLIHAINIYRETDTRVGGNGE